MEQQALSRELSWVARLLKGTNDGHAAGPWPDVDVAALVDLLHRNKFPLLALRTDDGSWPSHAPEWRAATTAAEREFSRQRREYVAVKKAWDRALIPCVAIKSGGTYPSFPYTSDNLDLLVPRHQGDTAKVILQELGYVWLRHIDERSKFLFRKFSEGRSVSAIHLHTWVGWDVEFLEDSLWERVRMAEDDAEVLVPSPEDAVLINTAHALYENKKFTLYDLERIRAQWQQHDLDWTYMEEVACHRGWLPGLYFSLLVCARLEQALLGRSALPIARIRRWQQALQRWPLAEGYYQRAVKRPLSLPFRVSFLFSKLLYYHKILKDQHDPPATRLSNLGHTLVWGVKQKSGLRPQPGILVSFSGLDGTGKTRHARALRAALRVSGIASRLVWSRPGCSPLYRRIVSLRKGFLQPSDIGLNGASSGAALPAVQQGRLDQGLRFGWAAFNAFDLLLLYLLRMRLPLLCGQVVVCDRYSYDAAVELQSRLPPADWLSRLPIRLLLALSPRPRLAYLLDVPADVAAARSADREEARELTEQRGLYLRLGREHGLRILDASREFTRVNDPIVVETLRKYEEGFDTFLNGLLLSNPGQLNRDDRPRLPSPEAGGCS